MRLRRTHQGGRGTMERKGAACGAHAWGRAWLLSAAVPMLVLPGPVRAQSEPAAPPPAEEAPPAAEGAPIMMLEAVTVTGEKIERSLRDPASSVSIFDAATNESRPALDPAQDHLDSIPNITTHAPAKHPPALRGPPGNGP